MLRLIVLTLVVSPLLTSVASDKRDPCEAPPAVIRQFGISYKEAVREAYAQSERGLIVLFKLSRSPDLRGMWVNCYATDIRKLLDVWGDKAFAAVLRKQSSDVRKAVRDVLHEISSTEDAKRYPESFTFDKP